MARFNILGETLISFDNKEITLRPWRFDRRLLTLRYLAINENRLRTICSYKSSFIGKCSDDIEKVLYTELDTCMWMLDDSIVSVYAVGTEGRTMSLILRTEKDVLCNIEIALTLSEDTNTITKHEFVGKEGVISDRSINEQIPFEAVYLFESDKKDPLSYTDMDSLMFGLSPYEISVTDNIIEILKNPAEYTSDVESDKKVKTLMNCVFESLKTGEVINVGGGLNE